MRRLLVVALFGLVAVACGAAGTGSGSNPSPSPSPSPSTGLHFDVMATEQDHAVTMRVGQRLLVALHGGQAASWQQVKSSDASILEPTVDPEALVPRGVTVAAFKAIAVGRATVTAVGTPVCPSGQACPMYAILYRLEVTVTL